MVVHACDSAERRLSARLLESSGFTGAFLCVKYVTFMPVLANLVCIWCCARYVKARSNSTHWIGEIVLLPSFGMKRLVGLICVTLFVLSACGGGSNGADVAAVGDEGNADVGAVSDGAVSDEGNADEGAADGGAADGGAADGDAVDEGNQEPKTVLATTGIWSDVVSNVACVDFVDVEAIIPVGGDPHGYEPSLRDRERMENADLVVANGLGLEERLDDTLHAVEDAGTAVFRVGNHISTIGYGEGSGGDDHGHEEATHEEEAHDEHAHEEEAHEEEAHEEEAHDEHAHEEEAHEEEAHDEEGHDDHGHGSGDDPHVWFDPVRVSEVLSELAHHLIDDAGLDTDAVEECLSDYQAELAALDAEIKDLVANLPVGNRKLITNHHALGYFADRYGFEVIGAVIPSTSTMAETNPAQLEELAELIEHEQVNAIFAETQHATDEADVLAARVGDIEVVTLYTGSLGPPGSGADTYVGFMRTNTRLIVDALS